MDVEKYLTDLFAIRQARSCCRGINDKATLAKIGEGILYLAVVGEDICLLLRSRQMLHKYTWHFGVSTPEVRFPFSAIPSVQHTWSSAGFIVHSSDDATLFQKVVHISSYCYTGQSYLIGNFFTRQFN